MRNFNVNHSIGDSRARAAAAEAYRLAATASERRSQSRSSSASSCARSRESSARTNKKRFQSNATVLPRHGHRALVSCRLFSFSNRAPMQACGSFQGDAHRSYRGRACVARSHPACTCVRADFPSLARILPVTSTFVACQLTSKQKGKAFPFQKNLHEARRGHMMTGPF